VATVYRDRRPDGTYYDKFRFHFRNYQGRLCTGTGTEDEKETRAIAEEIQAEHRLIRQGRLPAPTSADLASKRDYDDVVKEYLTWGRTRGGKGAAGWSQQYGYKQERFLEIIKDGLGFRTMADLPDCMTRLEKFLNGLTCGSRYIDAHRAAFSAFCSWCMRRGYLTDNPIKNLSPWSQQVQNPRRALTVEEIKRLLAVAAPERRIVYEIAIVTGLRAGEMKRLAVEDFDADAGGLHLRAAITKNRTQGFQVLPGRLVERLTSYVSEGTAERLHAAHGKLQQHVAAHPLLFLPRHQTRWFYLDLDAAGIPRMTFHGKLDFHSLRTTAVTHLLGITDVKTTMAIARHGSPNLTLNTYGRSRDDRVTAAVDALGELIEGESNTKSIQTAEMKKAAGAESLDLASTYGTSGVVGVRGFEPPAS